MASNAENVSIWWRHHEIYLAVSQAPSVRCTYSSPQTNTRAVYQPHCYGVVGKIHHTSCMPLAICWLSGVTVKYLNCKCAFHSLIFIAKISNHGYTVREPSNGCYDFWRNHVIVPYRQMQEIADRTESTAMTVVSLLSILNEQNSPHFSNSLICDPTLMLQYLFWQYLRLIASVHSVTQIPDECEISVIDYCQQCYICFTSLYSEISLACMLCCAFPLHILTSYFSSNWYLLNFDCLLLKTLKKFQLGNRRQVLVMHRSQASYTMAKCIFISVAHPNYRMLLMT